MKNRTIKIYITLLCLFASFISFSAPGDTTDETTALNQTDTAAAPIDAFILPMMVLGIYFGYQLSKRKIQNGNSIYK